MMVISKRLLLLVGLCLSSYSMFGMQELSKEEIQLLQEQYAAVQALDEIDTKLWDQVRSLLILWCGIASYDNITSPIVDPKTLIKGYSRGSVAFGLLGFIVTIRSLINTFGDFQKKAQLKQILQKAVSDFERLQESKRRATRRGGKMTVVPTGGSTDSVAQESAA